MKPIAFLPLLATAVAISSCGGSAIEVRSIKQTLAEGRQPANTRLAEGNAQLALGNVGLALEAYRKALREQPDNVEALMGLATCYDRMGRADLSRRHYEMALAVEPANTDIYSLFAQSLDAQGQRDEAARVKASRPRASRQSHRSAAIGLHVAPLVQGSPFLSPSFVAFG
jgi:Flp pilus assembly protein TadD